MGIRQIKKEVAKNALRFPVEMYTSLVGSVVITAYILNGCRADTKAIRAKWKYYVRHGTEISIQDEEFLTRICEMFGVEPIPLDSAAFVQSEYNALVCPYVEIEDGKKSILPLREDGYFTRTLRVGKVYPLTKSAKEGA